VSADPWEFELDLSHLGDDSGEDDAAPAPTVETQRSSTPPPLTLFDQYNVMRPSERAAVSEEFRAAMRAEADQYDAWSRGSAAASEPKAPLFIDLTALDNSDPVVATIGQRADGLGLLYSGAVNGLIGDPEQGKSLVALALALQVAQDGGTIVWLDLDHNGARAFRKRVVDFGGAAHLDRFKFASPEDKDGVLAVVEWTVSEGAGLFVVDSLGELLPMFGASSDSSDEYTKVHRAVLTAGARGGAAVLTIDHLAKGSESRSYGSTGTIAKKRAVDGALYRVDASTPFAPGKGGAANVRLLKDRHGSVRGGLDQSQNGVREPVITTFTIDAQTSGWTFDAPGPTLTKAQLRDLAIGVDADLLEKLTPPPSSQRDVVTRMKWGGSRALDALNEWRNRRSGSATGATQ
jgi:hypothetical protein